MKIKEITISEGRIKYIIVEGDGQVGSFIEILSIFIKEEYQQKGFGTELIKRLTEIAKRNNCPTICIKANTDGENDIFGKFLIATGFEKSPMNVFEKTKL